MLYHVFFCRLILAIVLTAACAFSPGVRACAPAVAVGQSVEINSETAVIVWDAKRHREDFIRRATFTTRARDIGFLVPTPTVPTLAEADPDVFDQLETLIHPPVRHAPGEGIPTSAPFVAIAPPSGVVVLDSQQVAGYQAVVLAADNAAALTRWLHSHGYAASPALHTWLEPYLRAHWKITAFKIAKASPNAPTVTSALVRMSFQTTQPFYPYREPKNHRQGAAQDRHLRVYLLASTPMRGRFARRQTARLWPGQVLSINQIHQQDRLALAHPMVMPVSRLPAPLYLTTFEDDSSPRPAIADVMFHRR